MKTVFFVKAVLPAVLVKTIYEKNFIVVEAKKIMNNAVQNCLCDETIQTLVEGCKSKNSVLAELSMDYLNNLIKNFDEQYF